MEKQFNIIRYLVLALLLSVFSVANSQTTFVKKAIFYAVTSDSTVMVIHYKNYKGKIVIPSEVTNNDVTYRVTALDEGVFRDTQVRSVELPSSITEIPKNAFLRCDQLTDVVFPESIETLGESSFQFCDFTKIVLPPYLKNIGDKAFYECTTLQEINWPQSLKTIGQEAFYRCDSLREVDFPVSLEIIGSNAFASSGISSVTFHEGLLRDLPTQCFQECLNLESIVLSDNITSIQGSCFDNCCNLKEVILSSNLQEIGGYAFRKCALLREIHMGNEMKTIGEGAFTGCSSLLTVDFGNSLERISPHAFEGCHRLQSIELPATLKKIDYGVFNSCTNLMKVTCHAEQPAKCSLDPFNRMTYWFATLIVPEACKNKYQHSEGWEHFEYINEESGNSRMVNITCSGDGGSVVTGNQTAMMYHPVWTSVPNESPLSLMIQTNSSHIYKILVNDVDMTDQVVDNQLTIPSVTEDLDINVSFNYRKFVLFLHQAEGGSFNLHETGRYKVKVIPNQGSRIAFAGFDGGGDISSWRIDEQGFLDISTEYIDRKLKIVFEKDHHEE